jgi:hypothetical protein
MAAYTLRLDPWSADYDASVQVMTDDEPAGAVRSDVETAAWEAIAPQRPPARPLSFVDGVRRIEHRLVVEQDGRTVFGLLGSFAVGAVVADGAARVARAEVHRAACTGGGRLLPEPFVATLTNGIALEFAPETVPEDTPLAPVQALQTAMRRAEAILAEELAGDGQPVLLDGPLSFLLHQGPVVGFVKRLLRCYLPPRESELLTRLQVGERTPLFLVEDRRYPRYSWYTRLARGRAIQSALAGIVRLETGSAHGLAKARALADGITAALPALASTPRHDPRAPQNLHPIGALESRLRHLMGDTHLVRRAVEARLHREVA